MFELRGVQWTQSIRCRTERKSEFSPSSQIFYGGASQFARCTLQSKSYRALSEPGGDVKQTMAYNKLVAIYNI